MLDLAMHSADGPVTLSGISARQKISLSYLEQLFGKLRRNAIVDSVRGPGGGYCLARDASLVTIADIIIAVEESIDSTQCGGRENCMSDKQRCMTHDLWEHLNDTVFAYLSSVKLSKLVEDQKVRPINIANPKRSAINVEAVSATG